MQCFFIINIPPQPNRHIAEQVATENKLKKLSKSTSYGTKLASKCVHEYPMG